MRILVVTFTYVIDVYQTKLDALEKLEDIHIGLLSPMKWKFPHWENAFELPVENKEFQIYPANVWFFNGRNGAYLYPIKSIYQAFKDFKPDMIYIEQEVFSLSTFQVSLIARRMKIPVAIFCWENMEKKLFLRRWLVNLVLDTAILITPGNSGAANLLRKWGYNGMLEIIPEVGVDTEIFSPITEIKDKQIFAIGYLGRIVYEKGVDLIFHAAKKLLDTDQKIEIILCGSGPYTTELKKLAKELEITEIVNWLGEYKHTEVPQAISKMDVLILPSRAKPGEWMEQFGHVLIEAMAMKVPVVGSDSGAIPDVIGREDLIFSEGNADALYKVLKKLIDQPNIRQAIAEYGYDRVHNLYSNEAIARRLRNIFLQVLTKDS